MSQRVTPPSTRTALGYEQTLACRSGKLTLQHCKQCGRVQYPHRELCQHCLSADLVWESTAVGGTVCATSSLHHSLEPFFKMRSPNLIGSIKLDCGGVVFAHLSDKNISRNARVQVINYIDSSGQAVLVALPEQVILDQTENLQRCLTALNL